MFLYGDQFPLRLHDILNGRAIDVLPFCVLEARVQEPREGGSCLGVSDESRCANSGKWTV